MARLTNEELNSIKKQYNVDTIYSWSRVNCFMNSPYEFYLKYIKHTPEDKLDSSYATLGGISHDVLDRYYEGKIKYDDMFNEFNDGWIMAIDMMDLKFNRTDELRNEKIKFKYKNNLDYFFKNHIPYKHKLLIEKPIKINIDNNIFVGYIDAIFKDDDDCYNIIDFKTSSIYKGKDLEEHSGQLVMYGLGLHQCGIPINKIKLCFNFLKYCTVEYQLANGKTKERVCERGSLGKDLKSNASMWLSKLGYEPGEYLNTFEFTNNIISLPEEVREKYTVKDCHVYIPFTQKLLYNWYKLIINTLTDIKIREQEYNTTLNEKIWWDSEESLKKQEYYFYNLCGYSSRLHLPWREYLEKQEDKKNGKNDLFSGVGENLNDNKNVDTVGDAVDLSWLNNV